MIGGFDFDDTTKHWLSFDLMGFADLQSLAESVTFRIFGFDATDVSGTYRLGIDDGEAGSGQLGASPPLSDDPAGRDPIGPRTDDPGIGHPCLASQAAPGAADRVGCPDPPAGRRGGPGGPPG